jgi:hypothetical protein
VFSDGQNSDAQLNAFGCPVSAEFAGIRMLYSLVRHCQIMFEFVAFSLEHFIRDAGSANPQVAILDIVSQVGDCLGDALVVDIHPASSNAVSKRETDGNAADPQQRIDHSLVSWCDCNAIIC